MDVDNNDVEGQLLRQFSSMGTTDKEVLIAELQKLIGNQLTIDGCAFFLDMNNWNLQAAICAFYDYEQPSSSSPATRPSMCLVRDVTIGEGESIPPNTSFVKTWRIQNNGSEIWPPGCCLRYFSGEQLASRDRFMVDALSPGQCVDVGVPMVSPARLGVCEGQWRMQTALGLYFGEVVWAIISVDENGILGVTQQLSQFGSDFLTSPGVASPFCVATPTAVRAVGDVVNLFASPPPTPSKAESDQRGVAACNGGAFESVATPLPTPSDSPPAVGGSQNTAFRSLAADATTAENNVNMDASHEVDMS